MICHQIGGYLPPCWYKVHTPPLALWRPASTTSACFSIDWYSGIVNHVTRSIRSVLADPRPPTYHVVVIFACRCREKRRTGTSGVSRAKPKPDTYWQDETRLRHPIAAAVILSPGTFPLGWNVKAWQFVCCIDTAVI